MILKLVVCCFLIDKELVFELFLRPFAFLKI